MSLSTYLEEVSRRAKAATPGAWYAHHCAAGKGTGCWCKVVGTAADPEAHDMDSVISMGAVGAKDADFIAHSRTDIEKLLAIVETQRKALALAASGGTTTYFRDKKIGFIDAISKGPSEIAREALIECERIAKGKK